MNSGADLRWSARGRHFRLFWVASAAALGLVTTGLPARAQNSIIEETTIGETEKKYRILPFAMYNETLELAGAVSMTARGLWQPQCYFQNTVFVSTNESCFLVSNFNDLRFFERAFASSETRGGVFGLIKVYSGLDEAGQEAGRNDSDPDNYREADGTDIRVKIAVRYLLPMGHGRGSPVAEIRMRDGDVVSGQTGATSWHPLASGRTFLELGPFYTYRDVDQKVSSGTTRLQTSTNGLRAGLVYENVDFSENPRRGSNYGITFTRDFGWFDSDTEWSQIEARYAKFIAVLPSDLARHSVLALGLWTSHCLTWDESRLEPDGERVYRRPPGTMGSTLGGPERLRGYDAGRFSDRSAVHYTVEYRHTPTWKPLRFKLLSTPVTISWIQLVGFLEAGRVAADWEVSELHEEMKWDWGIGVRPWVGGTLLRVDMGMSDEGHFFTMTIKQPF